MFKYFYFNLIVYKLGHEKEPKMYSIWHNIFKKLRLFLWRRSPKPPSRKGLLAFGNRSFAPSSLAISRTRRLYSRLPARPWLHLRYLAPNLEVLATPLLYCIIEVFFHVSLKGTSEMLFSYFTL